MTIGLIKMSPYINPPLIPHRGREIKKGENNNLSYIHILPILNSKKTFFKKNTCKIYNISYKNRKGDDYGKRRSIKSGKKICAYKKPR